MAEQDDTVNGQAQSYAEQMPTFVTVRQFTKYFSWPSEAGLRWMIFHAKKNGFNSVLIRVGRRVLIDTTEFEAWLKGHKTTATK